VRSLIGELAVEIRLAGPGSLSIGAADPHQSIMLDVRASDARRWADSARRLLSSPVRRAKNAATRDSAPAIRYRAILEEPGIGPGSLILSRVDSAGKATFTIFAADSDLVEVRQALDPSEAAMLVRLVRRAAVRAMPPPRRATPRTTGASKTASPPAPAAAPGGSKKPLPPHPPATPATVSKKPVPALLL
jgi:hypothetical protein